MEPLRQLLQQDLWQLLALTSAALALVGGLLYLILDAVSYSSIPSLDVPLKEGENQHLQHPAGWCQWAS